MTGDYHYFFDQEEPPYPAKRLLASYGGYESYELDEWGIIELQNDSIMLVHVSGCSCWPDRGMTWSDVYPDLQHLRESAVIREHPDSSLRELVEKAERTKSIGNAE